MGERKSGAVWIQTKPAEHPQTKERDKFLPLLTSKKNSFQLQMAVAWKQQRSPGVRACVRLCVFTCTAVYSLCIPIEFWLKRR